jgi:hypothetical protein
VRAPTFRTRKPVDALVEADFVAFPIREYAVDEEGRPDRDETWVKPSSLTALRKGLYSQLVRTLFTTARGEGLAGFMTVTTAGSRAEVTPGALVSPAYLPLPRLPRRRAQARSADWDLALRRALLRALRRREPSVFPIAYELQVSIGRSSQRPRGHIP